MAVIRRLKRDPSRDADFEELYDRYAPATFAFFLRKVGDRAAAADLNQELFLRLSRSLKSFEGRCSWRTWVFLLARNVVAEARAHRWSHLSERSVTLDVARFSHELRFDADPDRTALDVLLRDRLRTCLRGLSELARAVIVGHYFDGVTLRELTERLGLENPSGSRGVLIGAQRKLRRCLQRGNET